MRVEWVHPSWRDLVIGHLAEDPAARSRFVSRCSAHGVLLSLSFGGGKRGDRELPLLASDSDWDALTGRIYELAPGLDTPELCAVLDSISRAIAAIDPLAARLEAEALASTVVSRLAKVWEGTDAPIPLPALEAWLVLSSRLPEDSSRPVRLNVKRTWAELLPATAPSLGDRDSVERFADWLTFADLLREHRPEDLRRFRLGDQAHIIITFLDKVETDHALLQPAVKDQVYRALAVLETLDPELGYPPLYIWSRLRATQAQLPYETRHPRAEPLTREPPGWRLFDVARVLEDL